MRAAILLCMLAIPTLATPALAAPAVRPAPDCETAIAAAEREAHTADGLLAAIGVVESGRTDPRTGARHPWPWTVTAQGVGTYYKDKADAIAAVQALQARGVMSVDVGCMQVNLLHHPTAFRSLEEAFDPKPNAAYAARFLVGLYRRVGTWPAAAAAYHSLTPEIGAQYARLIAAVWGGAPVPVVQAPNGIQIVQFPGGGEMRMFREADTASGRGRIMGLLP